MLQKKIAIANIYQLRQPFESLAHVVRRIFFKCSRQQFNLLLLFIAFFVCASAVAQRNVTVKLVSVPAAFKGEPIFIAGDFNSWNPDLQKLSWEDDTLVARLNDIYTGRYEFKFTRGAWYNVECNARGKDIANRVMDINGDTTIYCTIEGWIDDAASFAKFHTASSNVGVMEDNFEMPMLGKNRHIWVYLPQGYFKSKQRYPVMYLQDGQNMFDEFLAPFGEWGVDECLDSMIASGKPGCIVIAIETGGMDRMSEYNPFEFTLKQDTGTITFHPKADEYLTDVIESLKPLVDKRYRTLTSKENTIIAGSSMGGLLAYYAALKRPDVFGKAGIFSPAFWTAAGIDSLADSLCSKMNGKYFFYIGGKEGSVHIDNMKRLRDKTGSNSSAFIYSVIDPEAEHNEKAWRKWFAEFYNWIMADGYNINTSSN